MFPYFAILFFGIGGGYWMYKMYVDDKARDKCDCCYKSLLAKSGLRSHLEMFPCPHENRVKYLFKSNKKYWCTGCYEEYCENVLKEIQKWK